jgi:hypothetical protein
VVIAAPPGLPAPDVSAPHPVVAGPTAAGGSGRSGPSAGWEDSATGDTAPGAETPGGDGVTPAQDTAPEAAPARDAGAPTPAEEWHQVRDEVFAGPTLSPGLWAATSASLPPADDGVTAPDAEGGLAAAALVAGGYWSLAGRDEERRRDRSGA